MNISEDKETSRGWKKIFGIIILLAGIAFGILAYYFGKPKYITTSHRDSSGRLIQNEIPIEEMADMLGTPVALTKDPKVVQQIREIRKQQMQQQQQMMMAQQAAEVGKTAGDIKESPALTMQWKIWPHHRGLDRK